MYGTKEALSVTKKNSPAEAKAPKKADNFVGKLNNLITDDPNNITGARDFLMISAFSAVHPTKGSVDPISSIPGLDKVLGGSAFVGLLALSPSFLCLAILQVLYKVS